MKRTDKKTKIYNFFKSKFLLFSLISPIFFIIIFTIFGLPKFSLTRFNGNGSAYLSRILNKNKNKKVGIFFLGNSRVNRGIDPKTIGEELNTKALNIGFRGKTYLRSYSLISEVFNLGYKPDIIILGINTGPLYYDCSPSNFLIGNKESMPNFEEFVKTNFLNIYNLNKLEFNNEKIGEYKDVSNEFYFNLNNFNQFKMEDKNTNINSAKTFIFDLRHTYNHHFFLKEPFIFSKAFDIPLNTSIFISLQRFLFVFNRSFQELIVFLKEIVYYRALIPPYIKGYDDIYWVRRFGDRNGSFQPTVTDESIENSDILSLYKGFSFGIPTLDFSKSELACGNKGKVDLLLLEEIRNLIKKNNSKLILIRMPRLYERYPSDNEINQIKNLLPEFIIHSKDIHQKLMKKENFADLRHFNLYGRKIYKKWLTNVLKKELNY